MIFYSDRNFSDEALRVWPDANGKNVAATSGGISYDISRLADDKNMKRTKTFEVGIR